MYRELVAALTRPQLVGHAGHHHAGREQQTTFETQRTLVVQQLLPPASDDVLRDIDRNDVARALPLDAADVVDDWLRHFSVRRLENLQRHGDAARLPFALHRLRV